MKAWRTKEDAWEEAERLEVKDICRRLGWTRRKLNAEMERVSSPEKFLERVRKAVEDSHPTRLLSRGRGDDGRGYTKTPYLSLQGEPEAVDDDYLKKFSDAARERERAAGQELVLAALEVRQVLRERVSSKPEFRALAGLSIRRLDKEIEKLIVHTRRKAA